MADQTQTCHPSSWETLYPGPTVPRPASTVSFADPIPEEYRPPLYPPPSSNLFLSPCIPSSSRTLSEPVNEASTIQPLPIDESSLPNIFPEESMLHRRPMTYEEILKCSEGMYDGLDDLVFDDIPYGEHGYRYALHLYSDLSGHPEAVKNPFHIQYNSYTTRFEVGLLTPILSSVEEWFGRVFLRYKTIGPMVTQAEYDSVKLLSGSWTQGFSYPYDLSVKQPTLQIRPLGCDMPTVVFEAGWSESHNRMNDDVDLWFRGSGGRVRVVCLIKWGFDEAGEILGTFEVHRAAGGLIETEILFPEPPGRCFNAIWLTREEIFGERLPPGRNPLEGFQFYVCELRSVAKDAMRKGARYT